MFLRYRSRQEWNGPELFDRKTGRVLAFSDEISGIEIEPIINTSFPKCPEYASAPRRIYLEITRRCNLNCRSCYNRSFSNHREMTFSEIERLSTSLYNAGVYEIRCTGGEPTQREDFNTILKACHDIGLYVSLGTNGVYSNRILEKVIAAPIDLIIISLDGSSEATNDRNRGSGTYRKIIRTLETVSKKDCRIRINTLVRSDHYSYEDIQGIAQIAEKYHVESVNCIPLRPYTHDPEVMHLQLTRNQFKKFIEGLSRLREEYQTDFVTTLDLIHTNLHDRVFKKEKSCAAGREGAVISPYGEMYGCSYSPASSHELTWEERQMYVAGNILEEDFLEIWNDSDRWSVYRDLERFKHPLCKECKYYLTHRCIGNCPIMNRTDPSAFDPYCYLHLNTDLNK